MGGVSILGFLTWPGAILDNINLGGLPPLYLCTLQYLRPRVEQTQYGFFRKWFVDPVGNIFLIDKHDNTVIHHQLMVWREIALKDWNSEDAFKAWWKQRSKWYTVQPWISKRHWFDVRRGIFQAVRDIRKELEFPDINPPDD